MRGISNRRATPAQVHGVAADVTGIPRPTRRPAGDPGPDAMPSTMHATSPTGSGPASGHVPPPASPSSGGPGAVPVVLAGTSATWSPAASLLAQLEAGDNQRLPCVDELPLEVRRQLAAVLDSRLVAIRQAIGMPPGEEVRLRADTHGPIEATADHPAPTRLQAAPDADALVVALVRYLHGPADVALGATQARDASGRVLAYVRADELQADIDPSRIPGHPDADTGMHFNGRDGMRAVAWAVAVAVVALMAASVL